MKAHVEKPRGSSNTGGFSKTQVKSVITLTLLSIKINDF